MHFYAVIKFAEVDLCVGKTLISLSGEGGKWIYWINLHNGKARNIFNSFFCGCQFARENLLIDRVQIKNSCCVNWAITEFGQLLAEVFVIDWTILQYDVQ